MRYTAEQVGAFWILGGGPRGVTAEAISQAYVESGFDSRATSSANYKGLWQDGTTDDLYDPLKNARAAVAKWRDGGNSFVKHWTNFQAPGTEAKRLAYMPRAIFAARRVQNLSTAALARRVRMNPASFNPLDQPYIGPLPNPFYNLPDGDKVPGAPDLMPDIPNPLDLGWLKRLADTIINVVAKIGDPETWRNAGKILLGFILLSMGLKRLFTIATT